MDTFEITNDKYLTRKHSTLFDYKNKLEENIYNSLFKFCVVRNPWEMMISYYFSPHWKRWNLYPFGEVWDEDSFIKLFNRDEIKSLRNFICLDNKEKLIERMDYIIRFENLNNEFEKVLDILKIENDSLLHKNKSNHKLYKKYYNKELKNMIFDKFNEEIKFFEYEF